MFSAETPNQAADPAKVKDLIALIESLDVVPEMLPPSSSLPSSSQLPAARAQPAREEQARVKPEAAASKAVSASAASADKVCIDLLTPERPIKIETPVASVVPLKTEVVPVKTEVHVKRETPDPSSKRPKLSQAEEEARQHRLRVKDIKAAKEVVKTKSIIKCNEGTVTFISAHKKGDDFDAMTPDGECLQAYISVVLPNALNRGGESKDTLSSAPL